MGISSEEVQASWTDALVSSSRLNSPPWFGRAQHQQQLMQRPAAKRSAEHATPASTA